MLGINSRVQLAKCEHIMRRRINQMHMENGVTFLNPEATMVDLDVTIGRDTVLDPGVHLEGNTSIGAQCYIRGISRISNSRVENGVVIDNSVIEESHVGDNVTIGPFAHLRPNSVLEKDVHIGNFVEVKKSHVGEGTKPATSPTSAMAMWGKTSISVVALFSVTTMARKNLKPS